MVLSSVIVGSCPGTNRAEKCIWTRTDYYKVTGLEEVLRVIRDYCQVVRFISVALMVKNPLANTGDTGNMGSIPRSGRSPGEGSGNPLQYSCLENSMDRGAWWAIVHGITKSQR